MNSASNSRHCIGMDSRRFRVRFWLTPFNKRMPVIGADLPLAGIDIDVECSLESLHPGHRHMALRRRLVQPVSPGRLTLLASPAPFHAGVTSTRKLAIGGEDPMKTCQIHAWLGHQGSQLRDEVQRLEYEVRSAVANRCRYRDLESANRIV